MTNEEKISITKYDLLYEQRMTRVETVLENLGKNVNEMQKEMKTDFRWLFGLIMASNASLFALMAHGFKWF